MPKKLFENGNPGKPHGAVNKITQKIRERVVKFLEDNIEQIQTDFETLKAKERLEFIEKILPYAVPKLHHVQNDHDGEIEHEIRVTWEMPKKTLNELQGSPNNGSVGNENGH